MHIASSINFEKRFWAQDFTAIFLLCLVTVIRYVFEPDFHNYKWLNDTRRSKQGMKSTRYCQMYQRQSHLKVVDNKTNRSILSLDLYAAGRIERLSLFYSVAL